MHSGITVLGGGWSGVCLANGLKKRNSNSDISLITAGNQKSAAGLLKTEKHDGFVFDTGGSHVIFSKNPETLNSMLSHIKGNCVEHNRNSFINFDGKMVPYPLENGMSVFSSEKRAKLGYDMVKSMLEQQADKDWIPRNLGQFFSSTFGKEATNLYFKPYNEKIWKRPLEDLDACWAYIPGRLPTANLKDVVTSIAGINTVGYSEQAKFFYPKLGGIEALYNSILSENEEKQVGMVYNETISKIRNRNNKWVINDRIETQHIYSTIPIPALVKALDAPEEVMKAADQLEYNNGITVGIALNKNAPNQHWIYVPNKDIIFHRYCWMSNYSECNAPNEKSSLLVEISNPASQKVDKEKITNKTINDLEKMNVIKSKEILFTKTWFNEFSYPVFTLSQKQKLETIFNYLKEINIKSIGRWGSWKYWNLDRTYEAMLEYVKKLQKTS